MKTRYRGTDFESEAQARWAVFFDAAGMEWSFLEREGMFSLDEEGCLCSVGERISADVLEGLCDGRHKFAVVLPEYIPEEKGGCSLWWFPAVYYSPFLDSVVSEMTAFVPSSLHKGTLRLFLGGQPYGGRKVQEMFVKAGGKFIRACAERTSLSPVNDTDARPSAPALRDVYDRPGGWHVLLEKCYRTARDAALPEGSGERYETWRLDMEAPEGFVPRSAGCSRTCPVPGWLSGPDGGCPCMDGSGCPMTETSIIAKKGPSDARDASEG